MTSSSLFKRYLSRPPTFTPSFDSISTFLGQPRVFSSHSCGLSASEWLRGDLRWLQTAALAMSDTNSNSLGFDLAQSRPSPDDLDRPRPSSNVLDRPRMPSNDLDRPQSTSIGVGLRLERPRTPSYGNSPVTVVRSMTRFGAVRVG